MMCQDSNVIAFKSRSALRCSFHLQVLRISIAAQMANERYSPSRTSDHAQLSSVSDHLEGNPANSIRVPSSDCDANESSHLGKSSSNSISSVSRSDLDHSVSEDDQPKKTDAQVETHDSPEDVQTSAASRRKTCHGQIIRLGWWGEIGSILLSVICTVLIFAILITMDGKPMIKWHLPIQTQFTDRCVLYVGKVLASVSDCRVHWPTQMDVF